MKKNFKFALVDSTSYCGKNALEFYSKALLEGGSRDTFRVVPGVKGTVKLPRYDAGNIIKDAGCSWSSTGEGTLSQKEMSVCAKDIQLELCATTFEGNFLGELLRPGHNTGEVTPQVFLDYLLEQVVRKIQNDLEIAVWQGDVDSGSYPTSICDGLLKQMLADTNIIDVLTPTTIIASTVIAEMKKMYALVPKEIINAPELRFYVSDNVFRSYQQAIANQSSEAYYVGEKEPDFLGIPLVWSPGLPPSTMVAAKYDNIVILTDLLSDEEELNVIPQGPITGVRTIRVAGGFKFGVSYLVSEEIVLYDGDTVPTSPVSPVS